MSFGPWSPIRGEMLQTGRGWTRPERPRATMRPVEGDRRRNHESTPPMAAKGK